MRIVSMIAAAAVAVSLGASCAQQADAETEKAAITAADAEWQKTAHDIDKFAAFFTTDGTVSMAATPAMSGQKAIKELFGPIMASPGFNLTWKPTRMTVAASGDLAYTAGGYELTLNNANGVPVKELGKFQTTWKKVDGKWKIVEHTGGPNEPTPVGALNVVVPAALVKWVDAPASLPKGAKLATIVGDITKPGPFTVRLDVPDGYRIPPHQHHTDENVTVLSGTFRIARGSTWDDKALNNLTGGSYANLAADSPHFMEAKGRTVLQLHGMGPFGATYVNPADDPSKK